MINLTGIFNTSCRGTIDNMLTFHAGGLGFNSRCWKCFFFLFFGPFVVVGFFSRKTYFHILTDLKYTGRLIAGFISTSYSQVPFDFPSVFFFFVFGLYIPFLLQYIFYKIRTEATCSHRLPFISLVQVNPLLSSQEHCSLGSCE